MTVLAPDSETFPQLTLEELAEVLGLTIKKDDTNKLITFLCYLAAYTKRAQFNISFNAPSSTGKSYVPLEIASLFPAEDLMITSYCSPTAFFHDSSKLDKERNVSVVDFTRKILVFLDQPHTQLLQNLRPVLSHDQEEFTLKITDRTKSSSLRTKNVLVTGFPAVTFCSATLKVDEQEATRLFLLSPEINQDKIRASVFEKIRKESDLATYVSALEANPARSELKRRIRAIREAHIQEIIIKSTEAIEKVFLGDKELVKPRFSRDVGRVMSLVKAIALLNLWHRDQEGSTLIANDEDVRQALMLWSSISRSQELNLPQYVYDLFQNVFYPLLQGNTLGATRQTIIKRHFEIYERPLADWQLRREILPLLEMAGKVMQCPDPDDKRRMLIILPEHYCQEAEVVSLENI